MKDIDQANQEVSDSFLSGEPDLFVVKAYDAIGRVELVHFFNLLLHDIFSSVITSADYQAIFPPDSLVWVRTLGVRSSGKIGMRVQEATCDDQKARDNYAAVIDKIHRGPSAFETPVTLEDGHNRFASWKIH